MLTYTTKDLISNEIHVQALRSLTVFKAQLTVRPTGMYMYTQAHIMRRLGPGLGGANKPRILLERVENMHLSRCKSD